MYVYYNNQNNIGNTNTEISNKGNTDKKMNETVVKLRREAALIENKLSTFKSLAVNILDGRTKYELCLLDAIDHVCEREKKDVDKLEIDYLEEIFEHIMSKISKNEDWPNWRVDFSVYDD